MTSYYLTDQGLIPRGISNRNGKTQHQRVVGNTTKVSHLFSAKDNVYGSTEILTIEGDDIFDVLVKGDFDL
jgi:hypothetical protein